MDGAAPVPLGASLDEMADATDRLLGTVDEMSDADLRAPSLLPGWTRAHVLTHVARNADALINLVHAVRTGEDLPMYPGGPEGRVADIEAGAGRHVGDVRLDVSESAERLLAAFAGVEGAPLDREVRLSSGSAVRGWEIPLARVREVEIHHVDLDLGYTPGHWSPEFATRTLDQLAPLFRDERDCPVGVLVAGEGDGRWEVAAAGPELSGAPGALVAWLTGRTSGEGLRLTPAGEVPPAPRWT